VRNAKKKKKSTRVSGPKREWRSNLLFLVHDLCPEYHGLDPYSIVSYERSHASIKENDE